MEQEKSGDKIKLLRPVGVHRAVSSMGADGVFVGVAWDGAER